MLTTMKELIRSMLGEGRSAPRQSSTAQRRSMQPFLSALREIGYTVPRVGVRPKSLFYQTLTRHGRLIWHAA